MGHGILCSGWCTVYICPLEPSAQEEMMNQKANLSFPRFAEVDLQSRGRKNK